MFRLQFFGQQVNWCCLRAELVSSPASPTLLDSHRHSRSSAESLTRAREVLEAPLALRLDVLAGPAQNKSYTTDPGVTQVVTAPDTWHTAACFHASPTTAISWQTLQAPPIKLFRLMRSARRCCC